MTSIVELEESISSGMLTFAFRNMEASKTAEDCSIFVHVSRMTPPRILPFFHIFCSFWVVYEEEMQEKYFLEVHA